MKFEGDIDIWKEFTKSIEEFDRSNFVLPYKDFYQKISQAKRSTKAVALPKPKNPSSVKVIQLNRSERRRFRSVYSIDLHGQTRHVDDILESFCYKCMVQNCREVTIITGKGNGIVKNATEIWLQSHPEFIIGYFKIKDSMKGSGAFGVRLRSLK